MVLIERTLWSSNMSARDGLMCQEESVGLRGWEGLRPIENTPEKGPTQVCFQQLIEDCMFKSKEQNQNYEKLMRHHEL